MCGLFGFSGRKDHEMDKMKILVLGAANQVRGTDSCGYYYNGKIAKGTDTEKQFVNLIAKKGLIKGNFNQELFLGHTRKSTVGKNNKTNAHPHRVANFVLTHNGTIQNVDELTIKYDVNEVYTVDSKGLAYLIDKKGFVVLEEYVGYAALAMTNIESDSLYLYKGASRETKNGILFKERPLYILEEPEGIYYSSIEESLNIISSGNKVIEIPYNTVIEILHGELTKYEFKVNRENVNIGIDPYAYASSSINSFNSKSDNSSLLNSLLHSDGIEIIHGRYKYKDQLMHGTFAITAKGEVVNSASYGDGASHYYFLHGIMIKDSQTYFSLKNKMTFPLNPKTNIAQLLSKYSRYPVMCMGTEALGCDEHWRWKWYEDEDIVKGMKVFEPLFSSKTYTIIDGETKDIKIKGEAL